MFSDKNDDTINNSQKVINNLNKKFCNTFYFQHEQNLIL